jgi:hypothetical protein
MCTWHLPTACQTNRPTSASRQLSAANVVAAAVAAVCHQAVKAAAGELMHLDCPGLDKLCVEGSRETLPSTNSELMHLDCPGLDKLWLAQLLPDAAPATLARSGLGSWPTRLAPGSSAAAVAAAAGVAKPQLGAAPFVVAGSAPADFSPAAAAAAAASDDEALVLNMGPPAVELVDLTLDDEEWVGQWSSEGEDAAAGHSSDEEHQHQQHGRHSADRHDVSDDHDSDGVVVIDGDDDDDDQQQQQQHSDVSDLEPPSPRQQQHASSWPWLNTAWQQRQQQQQQAPQRQQQQDEVRSTVNQMLQGGKAGAAPGRSQQQDGTSLLQMLGHISSAGPAAGGDEDSFRALLARIDASYEKDKQAAGAHQAVALTVGSW